MRVASFTVRQCVRHLAVWTIVGSGAGATVASAQTAVNVTLEGPAAAPTLKGDGVGTTPATFDIVKGATITVTCAAATPCGPGHTLQLRDSTTGRDDKVGPSGATSTVAGFTLPANSVEASADYTFTVLYDGKSATPVLHLHGVKGGAPTNSPAPTGGVGSASLTDLIATSCPDIEGSSNADFVVRPDGSVIQRSKRRLNEGDDVVVVVYGNSLLLPKLRVKRESAIRVPKLTNIFGANVAIPGVGDLNRQAAVEASCDMEVFTLSDFAPGAATIDISAITDKGYVSIGKIDFTVATLFSGAFAFGGMYTTVASPGYGFVYNGTDTVVSETGTRGRRFQYVLQYTPFVWGMRDLTIAGAQGAIYPMVGVVLNDVPNNGLAGVSLSLGSRVSFTWGMHAARVVELDPSSGLAVGSVYSVAARGATVPTVKHWTFKPFYSVAIDLSAASDLLHTVLGTSTTPP